MRLSLNDFRDPSSFTWVFSWSEWKETQKAPSLKRHAEPLLPYFSVQMLRERWAWGPGRAVISVSFSSEDRVYIKSVGFEWQLARELVERVQHCFSRQMVSVCQDLPLRGPAFLRRFWSLPSKMKLSIFFFKSVCTIAQCLLPKQREAVTPRVAPCRASGSPGMWVPWTSPQLSSYSDSC